MRCGARASTSANDPVFGHRSSVGGPSELGCMPALRWRRRFHRERTDPRYLCEPACRELGDSGGRAPGRRVWDRTLDIDKNDDRPVRIKRAERLLLAALQRRGRQAPPGQLLQHQRDADDDLLPSARRWLEVLACTGIHAVLRRPNRRHRRASVRRLCRHLLPKRTSLVPRPRLSFVLRRTTSPAASANPGPIWRLVTLSADP